jgi:hypothetical protein
MRFFRLQASLCKQSTNFSTFKEPKNRFQGTNSARLCSLAGRYDNPIPTWFLASLDCLKIPALFDCTVDIYRQKQKQFISKTKKFLFLCLCKQNKPTNNYIHIRKNLDGSKMYKNCIYAHNKFEQFLLCIIPSLEK